MSYYVKQLNRDKNKRKILEMEGYGMRLSLAMEERNYNQTSLSLAVGLSQPEISYFIKGHSFPRPIVSQKIAMTLFCSFRWLNFGLGDPNFSLKYYPLDEFWIFPYERFSYLIWSSNLTLREFLKLFPDKAAPMWFEPYSNRFPTHEQIQAICTRFAYPEGFFYHGWPLIGTPQDINTSSDFYIREYKKVFDVELDYVDLD
jgi:transcriptional regulator with XRE-family HTH domain